jgi:hypothetical protein
MASIRKDQTSETGPSKARVRGADKISGGGSANANLEQVVVKRVKRGSPKSARKGTLANKSVPGSRPNIARRRSRNGAKSAEVDLGLATETWDGVGVGNAVETGEGG